MPQSVGDVGSLPETQGHRNPHHHARPQPFYLTNDTHPSLKPPQSTAQTTDWPHKTLQNFGLDQLNSNPKKIKNPINNNNKRKASLII